MARLLLVDDEEALVKVVKLVLEAGGHEVTTASQASGALHALAETEPEIALIDLGLPMPADGLALIRQIAQHYPGVKIVALTGSPDELKMRPELKLVRSVLSKPVHGAALLRAIAALALWLYFLFPGLAARAESFPFVVARAAEVTADLEMSSPGSDWGEKGREAALATVRVDGRTGQHVMLYAGERAFVYPIFLGQLAAGRHELTIERHARYSAGGSQLHVHGARFRQVPPEDPGWAVLAHAPILCARADTVGGFTDIPLLAYCERLKTEGSGRPYLQYTVIFSNEDGGTSTRALMARWGRTADIEYIYKAWLDGRDQVTRATIQAKDHKEMEFSGRREGLHPVLIPSTRNNMVADQGTSPIRYQLVPEAVDLAGHSREQVMDGNPIVYGVMARELRREGKIRPFGKVEFQRIGDPRNYAIFEVKGRNRNAGFGVLVRLKGEQVWRASHLGREDDTITRDGWIRTTVELPPGTTPERIAEIGFECLVHIDKPDPIAGTCTIESVSQAFMLGPDYRPGSSFWNFTGPLEVASGEMRAISLTSEPGRSLP